MATKPKQNQVVKAILDSGQTRYAIGKATGISTATLCRMVNGEGWIGREAFDKLADYLGLEISIRSKRKGR